MRRVTGTWHATLVALVVAAMALAACATEPSGLVLTGSFGGRLLGLTATDAGADWRLACSSGFTGPLRTDHLGAGHARGTLYDSEGFPIHPICVMAMPIGDTLIVALSLTGQFPQTESYRLVRDVPPDFSGVYCPAGRSLHGPQ